MAEPSFETQLQRLFAEAPAYPDAALFTARVQQRLDRGWALRRGMIGVAGVAGGLIAAGQFVSSHLVARASVASQDASIQVQDQVNAVERWLDGHAPALHGLPMGADGLWLVAGLAAMGLALLAARVMERF
jgi:hypothetical protein